MMSALLESWFEYILLPSLDKHTKQTDKSALLP